MDFSKLTIGQLKRELALRTEVSARKSELVHRLVANFYSSFCKVIWATTLTPTATANGTATGLATAGYSHRDT